MNKLMKALTSEKTRLHEIAHFLILVLVLVLAISVGRLIIIKAFL